MSEGIKLFLTAEFFWEFLQVMHGNGCCRDRRNPTGLSLTLFFLSPELKRQLIQGWIDWKSTRTCPILNTVPKSVKEHVGMPGGLGRLFNETFNIPVNPFSGQLLVTK